MKHKYVTAEDEAEYAQFCLHHLQGVAGLPPGPLYHYTVGANLIAILASGQLWSTQISCLNDEKEVIYAAEILQQHVRKRLAQKPGPDAECIFQEIDRLLSDIHPEQAGIFVSCFSEVDDDLSQWRAYSEGEDGYALQFDPNVLRIEG